MNDQLRMLICAELTLLAISPSLRRWFRGMYDLIGPRLAKRVRTPVQADLAYLSMKPLEWAGWLLLLAVFGHPSRVTRCLGQGLA